MKILQLQLQKKNNYIGFAVSALFHGCLLAFILTKYEKVNFASEEPAMSISIKNFTTINQEISPNNQTTEVSQNTEISHEAKSNETENLPEKTQIAPSENLKKLENIVQPKIEKPIEKPIEKIIKKTEKPKKIKPKKIDKISDSKNFNRQTPNAENLHAKTSDNANQNNAQNLANTATKSGSDAKFNSNADFDNVGGKIQKIIASYAQKNYPQSAKRRKQMGVVKVSFAYFNDVNDIKITQSSGVEALDNAVIKAIEKTKHRFPQVSSKKNFTITVRFVLI